VVFSAIQEVLLISVSINNLFLQTSDCMKPLNKRTKIFTKHNLNMTGKFDPCDPKALLYKQALV
jgi:hypothetical protein